MSVLKVKLCNAVGLMSADANGLSDPYVKLTFAGETKKSETRYKTLNPVWDETFTFPCDYYGLKDGKIAVDAWDYDMLSSNDTIGSGELVMAPFLTKGLDAGIATMCSVELADGQEKPGVVHLELTWGVNRAEARAAAAKATADELNARIQAKNAEYEAKMAAREEEEESEAGGGTTRRHMKRFSYIQRDRIARSVDKDFAKSINLRISQASARKAAGAAGAAAGRAMRRMSATLMPSIGESASEDRKSGGGGGGRRRSIVAAAASGVMNRVRRASTTMGGAASRKTEAKKDGMENLEC